MKQQMTVCNTIGIDNLCIGAQKNTMNCTGQGSLWKRKNLIRTLKDGKWREGMSISEISNCKKRYKNRKIQMY